VRDTVTEVAKEFPDVTLEHQYVDRDGNALDESAEELRRVLTENLFGDIYRTSRCD